MQGYWDSGKFILASTQQDKIMALSDEVSRLRKALTKIMDSAALNGEDVTVLIATQALSTEHGQN